MTLSLDEVISKFVESLKGTEFEKYSKEEVKAIVSNPFSYFRKSMANNEFLVFKVPYFGTFKLLWGRIQSTHSFLNTEKETRALTKEEQIKLINLEKAIRHIKDTERVSYLKNKYNEN